MNRTNHLKPSVLLAMLAMVSTALAASPQVLDARKAQHGVESRNVRGGAEIEVSEQRLRQSLPERLQLALAGASLPQLEGKTVRITRAEVALFIEHATAIPGRISSSAYVRDAAWRQWPDELVEVRTYSTLARRSYRVNIEGELDGRSFSAQAEQRVQRIETRHDLERALDAGVAEAVRKISGG